MNLDKIALAYGLSVTDGACTGKNEGYHYSIIEYRYDPLIKQFCLIFAFDKKISKETFVKIRKVSGFPIPRIESVGLIDNAIVQPLKSKKANDKYYALLNKLTTVFNEEGLNNLEHCPFCGLDDVDTYKIIKGVKVGVHAACVKSFVEKADTYIQSEAKSTKHLIKSLILAFIGAVVGLIPAAIVFDFGYFVGLLYALIPLASFYGYKLGGGPKASYVPIVIAIFSAIVAPGYMYLLYSSFATTTGVPFQEVISDPELGFTSNLIMSLVFVAIGILISFRSIYNQTHGKIKKDLEAFK
ncbi:MAG: hypothetical protein KKH01_09620 [Firmicutes bacterium]|nr:hypothetical protein [Bacillota bacterium]